MSLRRSRDQDLKGWLKRKGGRMNTWSRRWFVLTDKFLFIYTREEESKSSDCITLGEHIIVEPPVDLNDPKRVYFDIVTDSDKAPSETVLSLCAESEEEKKTWVRALKRALYADKGGALFCQSLEEILIWEKQSGRHIPYIIEASVEYLRKNALEVEGLFRLPGRQSVIKDIISRFERGHKVNFEQEETDVHAVASVFKTFLRDLPDSIIPCTLFQKFMNFALRFQSTTSEEEKGAVVEELANGMSLIPANNYVILKYVCHFLQEVGLHESTNKMSMMNLGTVFGFNIIRHIDKENSQLFLCTADLGQNLVYMLINYYSQVFALEYTDSGAVASNVPTADLLRMSRIIDVAPVVPARFDTKPLSHISELEGLDLNVGLPLSEPSRRGAESPSVLNNDESSSHVRLRNVPSVSISDSGSTNDDDTVFLSSTELQEEMAKRPSLIRVLSQPTGSSRSLPASPTTRDPPIPPQRSKSKKLTRHRRVSDRRRPEGIVVPAEEKPGERSVSPRSQLLSPVGVQSEDVIAALEKVNIHRSNNESDGGDADTLKSNDSNDSTQDKQLDDEIGNGGDRPSLSSESATSSLEAEKPVPSVRKHRAAPDVENRVRLLQQQVTHLTEEMARQKKHHRSQLATLQSQLSDMQNKYERRIETMEVQFKSQTERLEERLTVEKDACATAVAYTITLKEELHRYQMQYGELPGT